MIPVIVAIIAVCLLGLGFFVYRYQTRQQEVHALKVYDYPPTSPLPFIMSPDHSLSSLSLLVIPVFFLFFSN
jgi:hypothetical protein